MRISRLLSHIIIYSASTTVAAAAAERTVYLHELDIAPHCLQDWGLPRIDRSVLNAPLSIGGTGYEHGLGTHSISRLMLSVGGKASRVAGLAGPDDTNEFATRIQFKILADGDTLWKSGVMTRGDRAAAFDIDISGRDKVLLLVEEAGDGIMYDHADWVDVRFTTEGEVTPVDVWPAAVAKEPYILTPPAPERPLINNPRVYGATPGSPFLWSVMASGRRPVTYEALSLPAGLALDPATGIITGTTPPTGDYDVTLIATNATGADTAAVTIKAGDVIALTPPMGWNSWNCWRFDCDDAKVRQAADVMAEKLHPYGWTYVNIDDGWEADERNADGVLPGNSKFPSFKEMIDYVHSRGIKFGLYSSPGCITCGKHIGSYGYEQTDADTWAAWGVDYLKYDYCGYAALQRDSEIATIQEPYINMRRALDRAGRDIVYCVGYGAPLVWEWGAEAGGNQWRTTRDINDSWNIVLAIGAFQDVCAYATAPGRYNDADMMVVGQVGGGWHAPKHPSLLTPDEQYSHVSLWTILSAPMLLGCDLSMLDDFTLSLVTNREVIAINQDPLCAPARKSIVRNGQIWHKPLSDGSVAVGCFNIDPYYIMWDEATAEEMQHRDYEFTVDLAAVGLRAPVAVRDVWRNADIMTVDTDTFTVATPYHGVKLLKITPLYQ